MELLFVITILISFGLWMAAAIPGSRISEFWARIGFFIAAILWALPHLT